MELVRDEACEVDGARIGMVALALPFTCNQFAATTQETERVTIRGNEILLYSGSENHTTGNERLSVAINVYI